MKMKRSDGPSLNGSAIIRAALKQSVVVSLGALLVLQTEAATAFAQEPAQPAQPSSSQVASNDPSVAKPAKSPEELPAAPEPQAAAQQPQGEQEPGSPQQPVGTAAAPYEKPTGVAGSRPAGAAIAPAKQRRVRAIVIKVGLLLAGAGAVGAVVGLSKASHSQP